MPLSPVLQAEVVQLLDGATEELRTQALQQLLARPDADKVSVAEALEQFLPAAAEGRRVRILEALGDVRRPETTAVVVGRLAVAAESSEQARLAAAIALFRIAPADLQARLEALDNDPRELVQALGRRLRAARQFTTAQPLVDLVRAPLLAQRSAACRMFRSHPHIPALSAPDEQRAVPALRECLANLNEDLQVRTQAALALGDVNHEWPAAIQGLGAGLLPDVPVELRRQCLASLRQIRQPQSQPALVLALLDADAEIRVQAADGLRALLSAPAAASLLVERLLQDPVPHPFLLDALRHIDPAAAVRLLTARLIDPDRPTAERAARIIAQLDAREVFRLFRDQRANTLQNYPRLPANTEQLLLARFQALLEQTGTAATLGFWMHILFYGLLAIGAALGTWVMLANKGLLDRLLGVGLCAVCLGLLVLLVYLNPLRHLNRAAADLVKLKVIFLSSLHQINQTEAMFRQMYLAASDGGIADLKEAVKQIQATFHDTLDQVDAALDGD